MEVLSWLAAGILVLVTVALMAGLAYAAVRGLFGDWVIDFRRDSRWRKELRRRRARRRF